jgi:hypothetical protein
LPKRFRFHGSVIFDLDSRTATLARFAEPLVFGCFERSQLKAANRFQHFFSIHQLEVFLLGLVSNAILVLTIF